MSCAPCERVNIVSGASGHCCEDCAQASAIRRARHVALYAPRAVRRELLANLNGHLLNRIAIGFVTDSDIDTFNDALTKLRTDIVSATDARRTAAGDGYLSDPAYVKVWVLEGKSTALKDEWQTFVADHTGTLSRFSDSEFAAFKLRYSDLFAEFKALGYDTKATDIGPGSNPGDKGKSPLEALGVPKWAIPVGLGVLAIVLLGPALGPALGSIFAAKAVVTGAKVATGVAL